MNVVTTQATHSMVAGDDCGVSSTKEDKQVSSSKRVGDASSDLRERGVEQFLTNAT